MYFRNYPLKNVEFYVVFPGVILKKMRIRDYYQKMLEKIEL